MYKNASRFNQNHPGPTRRLNRANVVDSRPSKEMRIFFESHSVVKGRLDREMKGGYRIIILGQIAFCPYSEMYPSPLPLSEEQYLRDNFVEYLTVEVTRSSVVVSRKRIVLAWSRVLNAFEEKSLLRSKVKKILQHGVVIDLWGIQGFLRFQSTKKDPKDYTRSLEEGQTVNVRIVDINYDKKQRIRVLLPKQAWLQQCGQAMTNVEENNDTIRVWKPA